MLLFAVDTELGMYSQLIDAYFMYSIGQENDKAVNRDWQNLHQAHSKERHRQ